MKTITLKEWVAQTRPDKVEWITGLKDGDYFGLDRARVLFRAMCATGLDATTILRELHSKEVETWRNAVRLP